MRKLLIDTLSEAKRKLEYEKVSNLTLTQRISRAVAIEKINLCIQIINRFDNIS